MIVVARAALALVVDRGRFGHMHEGVPWGGPMVPELFARANRAAGNDEDEACIELHGPFEVRAESAIRLADERGVCVELAPGESLQLASDPGLRVRYLAIGGGVEAPSLLHSRSTLLGVMGGPSRGQPIRRGDRLSARAAPPSSTRALGDWPLVEGPIALVAGPDADRFPGGVDALVRHEYELLPTSNRQGTRLRGPSLVARAEDARPSMPMALGALQIPPTGMPIVLGPDHPTTGGYPVAAVIAARDLGRFHALPLGSRVRFAFTQ